MIHPYAKRIMFGAEEVFLSSVDYSSGGGWYYRPDRTDKSTFGRGEDGKQAAMTWMEAQLRDVFNRHHWQIPTEIDNPLKPHVPEHKDSPSLHAGYMHPVFGQVEVSLYFDGRDQTCEYQLRCHALAPTVARRQPMRTGGSYYLAFDPIWTFKNRIHNVQWASQAFRKNPLNEALMGSKDWIPLAKVLDPPKEFKRLDFLGYLQEQKEPREGIWSYAYRNADLITDPERIKEAIIQGLPELVRCFDALAFLGFQITPLLRTRVIGTEHPDRWAKTHDKRVSPKREAILEEITITLPRSASPPYEEPHTIRFSDAGIGLTCGYHKTISLYNEYKKIQDQRLVDEVLGLARETTIDKIKGDT